MFSNYHIAMTWHLAYLLNIRGRTRLIDHPSPVYSEQYEYTHIDKSLFIDINMVTFRQWVLSAIWN